MQTLEMIYSYVVLMDYAKSFWALHFTFNKASKKLNRWRSLKISKSSKIELFEGDKVFTHKVICIFGSVLIVRSFKSCQSVKKVSRSWAMSSNNFSCILKRLTQND